MTLSIMALRIITLSTTTLSIKGLFATFSMKGLFATFSIMTLSIKMLCHYAECQMLFTIKLSVIMLRVVILSVIMLSVIMLSVKCYLLLS